MHGKQVIVSPFKKQNNSNEKQVPDELPEAPNL